jgi:hypothetical protein
MSANDGLHAGEYDQQQQFPDPYTDIPESATTEDQPHGSQASASASSGMEPAEAFQASTAGASESDAGHADAASTDDTASPLQPGSEVKTDSGPGTPSSSHQSQPQSETQSAKTGGVASNRFQPEDTPENRAAFAWLFLEDEELVPWLADNISPEVGAMHRKHAAV